MAPKTDLPRLDGHFGRQQVVFWRVLEKYQQINDFLVENVSFWRAQILSKCVTVVEFKGFDDF